VAAPRRGPEDAAVRALVRGVGELLVTAGAVVLLFAGWLVVGTGWAAARAQSAASAALAGSWSGPAPAAPPAPVPGDPVLRLAVPRFDRSFVVLEGTGPDVLARGPGRYPGGGAPGEPGNVAIAGHRVTRGAPFEPAEALRSCDPLLLETRDAWWVYRVLPLEPGPGPACGVALPPEYAGLPGRRVVAPGDGGVIAPVPDRPGAEPRVALLTLTTCHPRYSARQRLVVHAVLAGARPKAEGPPPELPARLATGEG
jgi:sortase A